MGTLADFLEVDGQYEGVVDEFLRDELNYVVVKSWDAADAGVRMLQSDVAGRATFLVHGEAISAAARTGHQSEHGVRDRCEGAVALKDCVRVLNGFGNSLEGMLPKLRDGFIAQDADDGAAAGGGASAGVLPEPERRGVSQCDGDGRTCAGAGAAGVEARVERGAAEAGGDRSGAVRRRRWRRRGWSARCAS